MTGSGTFSEGGFLFGEARETVEAWSARLTSGVFDCEILSSNSKRAASTFRARSTSGEGREREGVSLAPEEFVVAARWRDRRPSGGPWKIQSAYPVHVRDASIDSRKSRAAAAVALFETPPREEDAEGGRTPAVPA